MDLCRVETTVSSLSICIILRFQPTITINRSLMANSTIIVFRIIALLINFPAVLCDPKPGFVLAPLPARKSLWEACDEAIWRSEIEWSLNDEKDFGLTENGNLVRLKQQVTSGNDENSIESISAKNWEDWCSEMDEFGALIMIGASLL